MQPTSNITATAVLNPLVIIIIHPQKKAANYPPPPARKVKGFYSEFDNNALFQSFILELTLRYTPSTTPKLTQAILFGGLICLQRTATTACFICAITAA